jgi:uncharacterized protein (TIGR02266 family)
MTQDTRKDRRVKIVSLNVRYKSATVDEFIENHAHDVSRGGIYIKTGSPFPPGTLLKFEIRLASDQAVITGVGRVVWKRDTTQGTGERPAGMGVKFIKIDDPSKSVIDRLVNSRSDAGRSYEAESEAPADGAAPAARPASNRPAAKPAFGKSTMLGIGATPAAGPPRATSARPAAGSVPPRPSTGGAMFPATASEAEMPPKQEQTVMKQAAELLEEALREAGGSMEDVGTNPLFAGSAPAEKSEKIEVKPASVAPADGPPSSGAEAERARAMVAGMAPASPRKALTDPPRTTRESPGAKAPDRVEARPVSGRPSSRPSIASAPPKAAKKSSGGGTAVLLAVVVVAGAAGYLFRDDIFGGAPAPAPAPSAAATVSAEPSASVAAIAPSASEAPAVASAAPAASASAAAATSASAAAGASAAPSASAAASAPPTAAASAPPRPAAPRPRPAAPAPAPAATAAATATATDTDTAAAPPATATATATATAAPKAAPAPAAPKKPAKPADDNPY